MPITVIRKIPGRDIPSQWTEGIKESPEQTFTVIIRPEGRFSTSRKGSELQGGQLDFGVSFDRLSLTGSTAAQSNAARRAADRFQPAKSNLTKQQHDFSNRAETNCKFVLLFSQGLDDGLLFKRI